MTSPNNDIVIKLTKTLFLNTYRGLVTDADQNYLATIKIIPGLPLDKNEIPEDAPAVSPFLTIIVEDAIELTTDTLLDFETRLSRAIIKRMKTPDFLPQSCQFYYPSPAFLFGKPDVQIQQ